jgi:hypothetical protein
VRIKAERNQFGQLPEQHHAELLSASIATGTEVFGATTLFTYASLALYLICSNLLAMGLGLTLPLGNSCLWFCHAEVILSISSMVIHP